MNPQFKRGIVELLVMKVLDDGPLTSYEVIKALNDTMDVNANTIYPILRRLNEKGYAEVDKAPSKIGAPRKRYQLTDEGKTRLASFEREWKDFLSKALTILGGKDHA